MKWNKKKGSLYEAASAAVLFLFLFVLCIIGMLLLTFFLKTKIVKLEWVEKLSQFLLANLGFFFVPPGVALMLNFDTIARDFWPITIATLVSTVLVLLSTGWTHQIVRRYGPFHK
mgnify:CR=1 FL=1